MTEIVKNEIVLIRYFFVSNETRNNKNYDDKMYYVFYFEGRYFMKRSLHMVYQYRHISSYKFPKTKIN